MAKNNTFSILTGGGADSLDAFVTPGNGDFAFGIVSGLQHSYVFDTSETGSENSPYQIKADDATTGSWMLVGFKGAMSHVRATTDASQSIPNSTHTYVIFEDEVYDTLGEYVAATGIFTATYSGYYKISCIISFISATWASGKTGTLYLYINNSRYADGGRITPNATGLYKISMHEVVYLDPTDTVRIDIYHDYGGALALVGTTSYNCLTIDRIV